ncbi:hypothetical protein [Paraburkholderia phenoliruptrix]|uniref:hypothetical protein n=1 Tax=Paraburkholderia phenoliruptrix TaxID=252970 RepID=UPI002869D7B6|nr:hypothetical protein [Paraburkholderia phenoliruptrix]WMY11308.1 hypothetical protein P3F88_32180 [Paraburkholderia phenoliruptrix]
MNSNQFAMKLISLPDKVWPYLDRPTKNDMEDARNQCVKDVAQLRDNIGRLEHDVLLEEARRLYDEEEERRRVADSKATTYLLVAAALVPVLTYFEGVVWGDKVGSAPRWMAFGIISLALLYLTGFAWYAFRALKLVGYHRIGTSEVRSWVSVKGVQRWRIANSYLSCTRQNQDKNNLRLTWLNLAHRFIVRIFICFAAVCLLEAGYGVYDSVSKLDSPSARQPVIEKSSSRFLRL